MSVPSSPIDQSSIVDHFRPQIYPNRAKNNQVTLFFLHNAINFWPFLDIFLPKITKYWNTSILISATVNKTLLASFPENLNSIGWRTNILQPYLYQNFTIKWQVKRPALEKFNKYMVQSYNTSKCILYNHIR